MHSLTHSFALYELLSTSRYRTYMKRIPKMKILISIYQEMPEI